jgi:hypothetical protein
MAQSVTLKDLRDRTLDYADMPNSAFPDPSRLDDYINTGLASLQKILVNSFQDYYLATQNLTLVAGQETYDLPANFYKSKEVFYETAGRRYGVPRFNRGEIDGYRPGSQTAGNITHWYVPQIVKLRQPTDKVDDLIVTGWEDYIALFAAVRLLIKEESDVGDLRGEREAARLAIIDQAEPRDEGDQGSVEDTYGRWTAVHDNFREWRYLRYRIMGKKIYFYEFEFLGA